MLNAREKKYCDEFLICGNQAEAARRAGYSNTTADKNAPLWIGSSRQASKKPAMWDYVKEKREELENEYNVTKGKLLNKLDKVIEFDPADVFDDFGDLLPLREIPIHWRKCISSIEIMETKVDKDSGIQTTVKKIKFNDRLVAAAQLSKMQGYNAPEEVKHDVKVKSDLIDLSKVPLALLKELKKYVGNPKQ